MKLSWDKSDSDPIKDLLAAKRRLQLRRMFRPVAVVILWILVRGRETADRVPEWVWIIGGCLLFWAILIGLVLTALDKVPL